MTLLVIGHATAADNAGDSGGGSSNSLTCTFALPPYATCLWERTGWSLWGLEGAYGVQVSLDFSEGEILALSPYTILAYYADDYAIWAELRLPDNVVPVIGDTDFLRVGFSYRW